MMPDKVRGAKCEVSGSESAVLTSEVGITKAEYWRHVDGMYKDRETGVWRDRGRKWPTHLLDCERMLVALASFLGIFSYDGAKQDSAPRSAPGGGPPGEKEK